MAATVVAPPTVAVAAASLGSFAVTAAAVNLVDVVGSRRTRAVVTRGVGGRAVGACVRGLAGWRRGQLGRGKTVVAPMNSASVGRNFMDIYRTNRLRQTKFLWVPSGLNRNVMVTTEAGGHRMSSGVGVCGSV